MGALKNYKSIYKDGFLNFLKQFLITIFSKIILIKLQTFNSMLSWVFNTNNYYIFIF